MQKKLFHLYLKVNLYSKLYTMTQKTKILTLSLVSVAGLAAFTVFASNNVSLLDFKGEVKQNINLELKQLNLMPDITQKNNGGAAGISWKIVWDTLTTVDPATNAPNTVTKQGKFSFGGHGNITNAAESLILAGEENNLSANTSIVGASKKIVGNQGEGNTVLSSSDITFTGDNHIISSSAGTQVNGTGNIVFSSEDVAINTIGSMAVGKKISITHPGSFIFNGTDTEVASNKEYTTKIMADKGMIINTNSQKAVGVDLTINGGLKVAHRKKTTPQDREDSAWSIIYERNCLKIKGVNKGEIWFWCSTTPETQISTPKCGKNAADYLATANAWKESTDKGFCENGTLSPSTRPTFWTDAEKAAAKSNGSYASAGFGNYSFTICFVEGDPFCKASGAKKTWRCTTQEGNAMTCEATIEGSKTPVTEPKKCNPNQHLEGTTCVANTKQVACDNTNINSANGTISNNQVTITRSNGKWSAPEKCTLNCNTGYEKKTNLYYTHRESCEKKTGQPTFPKYRSCKPTKVPHITWLRCDGNNCPVYKKWSRWEWREILNYAVRSYSPSLEWETKLEWGESHWFPVTKELCLRPLGECVPAAKGDFPSDLVEYTITNPVNGYFSRRTVNHWDRYIEILGLIKHNSDGTKSLTPEGEQFSAMNMTNSSSSLCYTTNDYCYDKAIGSECK